MWYNRDMEIEKLKKAMADVEAPRRTDRGNIRHKLEDILIFLPAQKANILNDNRGIKFLACFSHAVDVKYRRKNPRRQ